MTKLKTYSEFINEGIIDAIKNPIKWKKIKNNAKKFQKAKVAHALNDVDYAKKLASSNSKKETDVLKKTNAVKNASLKDIQGNIGTRMDDLATTKGLQAVVKLAKTKSSLAANKIIIKAATGEQAKQLKIKQKELVGKVSKAKNALKDYETTEKPKEETESDKLAAKNKLEKETKAKKDKAAIEKAQAVIDSAKAKYDSTSAEDKGDKIDAEIAFKQAQQKKATLEGNDELAQGFGNDISELMKKKELDKGAGGSPKKEEDSKKLTDLKAQLADAIEKDIPTRIKFLKKEIANEEEAAKKNKPNESYTPLVESVSDKFKRLRLNM